MVVVTAVAAKVMAAQLLLSKSDPLCKNDLCAKMISVQKRSLVQKAFKLQIAQLKRV